LEIKAIVARGCNMEKERVTRCELTLVKKRKKKKVKNGSKKLNSTGKKKPSRRIIT